MTDITLSIPSELVETLINMLEFILFIAACMVKGAAMLWGICFVIWVACMALTVPYMTIKSILNKD
tara:strand:- start:527 stop:724 length:198 start_codon:yes stop_codon:yes gene_type:complete